MGRCRHIPPCYLYSQLYRTNGMGLGPNKLPDVHHRYALRRRTGCRGDRGLSATATAYQPSSRVKNSSQLPPNQRHIHFVESKYCEDTRPRSQLEAAHHHHGALRQNFAELRSMLACTLFFWEWEVPSTALIV